MHPNLALQTQARAHHVSLIGKALGPRDRQALALRLDALGGETRGHGTSQHVDTVLFDLAQCALALALLCCCLGGSVHALRVQRLVFQNKNLCWTVLSRSEIRPSAARCSS